MVITPWFKKNWGLTRNNLAAVVRENNFDTAVELATGGTVIGSHGKRFTVTAHVNALTRHTQVQQGGAHRTGTTLRQALVVVSGTGTVGKAFNQHVALRGLGPLVSGAGHWPRPTGLVGRRAGPGPHRFAPVGRPGWPFRRSSWQHWPHWCANPGAIGHALCRRWQSRPQPLCAWSLLASWQFFVWPDKPG